MFVIDDAAIAAAVAAAEAAAAEAAAGTAAATAAQAGAGAGAGAASAAGGAAGAEAGSGLAATQAVEAATTQAVNTAATQAANATATQAANAATAQAASAPTTSSITDAVTQAATGAEQGIMAETLPQGAANNAMNFAPDASNAVANTAGDTLANTGTAPINAPLDAPIDVTPPPIAEGPVAQAPVGPESVATPPVEPSIGSTLADYAAKAGEYLMKPEVFVPLALQGAGALMSNSAYDDAGDYTDETLDASTSKIKAEEAKSNKAVEDWGANYLSPEAIQKNQDDAYAKLAADYVANQDRAQKDLGGVVGNTPDEYAKAMAGASANSAEEAAAYARSLAKAQAPAFADINTGIGELKAGRETANALSDMKSAGAEGYNDLGVVEGDNKLLASAALRGLGSGFSTLLGK